MKPSSPISLATSSIARKTRLSPYLFTLLAFILFVSVLYGEDFMCIFGQLEPNFVLPPSRTTGKVLFIHSTYVWILSLTMRNWDCVLFWISWILKRRTRSQRSLRFLLVKQKKVVTFSAGSGWEMKSPDHRTKNGSVRTFNLSLRVKNTAVPTKITNSGGGNPIIAIFPRKLSKHSVSLFHGLLCFLCFMCYSVFSVS